MQSVIQLAGFHYIVCLKALPTNLDYKLKIGKMEYVFDAIRSADSRALHAEFQQWATLAVLRDLIESFSSFLMEVYADAMRVNPNAVYSASVDQFERKGIEDQLDILLSDFCIDRAWVTRLTGYNRARNCLAHRQGIVGARDATDGSELVVRWLASSVWPINDPVVSSIEAAGPMSSLIFAQHIHGGAVRLEIQDKEKRTGVGSKLQFLPADILEICQTFQTAAVAFGHLNRGV